MAKSEDLLIDFNTKVFGKQVYSTYHGLHFDRVNKELNGKISHFGGLVFEDFTQNQIKKSIKLVDSLEKIDAKAREIWLQLLEEDDEVVLAFTNEHYNEYGDEIKELIFKKLNIQKQDNRAFINNLEFGSFHICKIDEDDSVEIVMDYSLIWDGNTSFTDQILAMHFTDELEYELHTHDS